MPLKQQQLEHVQKTWLLGHGPYDIAYKDLGKLEISDPRIEGALASRSNWQVSDLAPATFRIHNRAPAFDGQYGDAVKEMLDKPRCNVPDVPIPKEFDDQLDFDLELKQVIARMRDTEPALGQGNWKRCHNVGDFHSASVAIHSAGMPRHVEPYFKQIMTRVQKEYSKFGCLFRFIENGKDYLTGEDFEGNINIDFSFVSRSSGWIGLAIVGKGETCSGQIWCKYLATYKPSDILTEWTTLILHELGHNCGRGHTRGGVMNPSIVRGLGKWAEGDPSYSWLQAQFGGEAVGTPDPPTPPEGLEARVAQLERQLAANEVRDVIQDAMIEHLLTRTE